MIFFNSLGIVQFIGYIIDTRGGMSQFVEHCLIENIRINFGSPPFFCLLPLNQPMPTKRMISLTKWGPIFLLCVKISILSVDLIFLILGYHQSGYYLDVDNIHYILSIPAGVQFYIYVKPKKKSARGVMIMIIFRITRNLWLQHISEYV